MSQIIDLRKKEAPLEPPKPPIIPVPTVELAPDNEPVIETEDESLVYPETDGIGWWAHLSPPHNKKQTLNITIGLVLGAILVIFINQDFLFAIVLVLAAIVLNLNATRPHRPSEIKIHATGVSIDEDRHHYADMKSFWIHYYPNFKELSIELKKSYTPRIRVPLEDTNPLEVRQAMIAYVPEKEHEHSVLDHIIRLIGI
jgi:hypothetical protein